MSSSKLQAEIREYTSNQANNTKLMNFYRCAKTLAILNNLFITDAISKQAYSKEARDVFQTYNILKADLQTRLDVRRFSELWEIQYHQKIYGLPGGVSIPRRYFQIATLLPQLMDELYIGETHGSIYETFTLLCEKIQTFKQQTKFERTSLSAVIEEIIRIQRTMKSQYMHPTDRLIPQQKELLRGNLNKFKVELEMEYKLR